MKEYEFVDLKGIITPLGELLSCPRCGMRFKQCSNHVFRPGCDCIKKEIRISVG